MKKKVIILVLSLLVLSDLFGQTSYFNNIFHINGLWTYGRSIIYKDNYFYSVALTYDTIGVNGYRRISFCKSDSNGNLVNYKTLGWGRSDFYAGYPGCLQRTSDNCLFTVGDIVDTIQYNAYLIKVNFNFDTVFYKKYKVDSNLFFDIQQGKETYDKGYILAGTIEGPGTYDEDIFILKTDSLGNEQWRKTYNLGGVDYARNVIQTPDKGFLLGCYTYTQYYLSGDGRILKLDSLGNVEFGKAIGGPYQDGVPRIALANDSNYIVATSYADTTIFNAASDLRIQILKLDKTDGGIIWNKQYDTIRTSNYPYMVKVLDNGDIISTGITGFYDGLHYYRTSWILKLKPNGDSIYYRQFYYSNNQIDENTVSDFCITEDKSIVICGYVSLNTTSYDYLWLAKLDSFGCIQPGCQTIGIEEIKYQKNVIVKAFPNPATNQTKLTYPQLINEGELQIYNILGQLVYQEKLLKSSTQKEINIQNFKAGLYKVIVRERGIIKGQVGLIKN